MLFEMISGSTPFKADSDAELMAAHMYKAPPRLREKAPTAMPELAALVEKMLAKKPADRPSAAEVAQALSQLTGQRASSAMPVLRTEGLSPGDSQGLSPTMIDPAKTKAPPPPSSAPIKLSRGQLTAVGGLLVVLVALVGALVVRDRLAHRPVTPPPVVSPPSVTWSITSQPPGAEVIGFDNKVLGRTPLVLSRPKAQGTETLTLRAPGHRDLSVRMDTSGDVSTELKLEPAPPETPEDPPPSKGKGGKKKGGKSKRGKG